MKPWKTQPKDCSKPEPQKKANVCSCCMWGTREGWICVECETLHQLIEAHHRAHAEHHEETKEFYREVIWKIPAQEIPS